MTGKIKINCMLGIRLAAEIEDEIARDRRGILAGFGQHAVDRFGKRTGIGLVVDTRRLGDLGDFFGLHDAHAVDEKLVARAKSGLGAGRVR